MWMATWNRKTLFFRSMLQWAVNTMLSFVSTMQMAADITLADTYSRLSKSIVILFCVGIIGALV